MDMREDEHVWAPSQGVVGSSRLFSPSSVGEGGADVRRLVSRVPRLPVVLLSRFFSLFVFTCTSSPIDRLDVDRGSTSSFGFYRLQEAEQGILSL